MRVVTLNLWGDHVPLAARLDAAAAGLAALAPDVVLLQEVRQGDGLPNTAHALAERLGGWAVAYACATAAPAGTWGPASGAGEEGLAIMARHPLDDVRHVELPEARAAERRMLLSARVTIAGSVAAVHTTHLHWRLGDGVARERQVVALDAAARAYGGEVRIVGGDFNAGPDTDELRFLTGQHTLDGQRAVWQDAFATVRPGEPGFTWARRNPQTAELAHHALDRRIDFILVSPERRGGVGRVEDARVVLDEPGATGVHASDHFGVVADVALTPATGGA